MPVTHLFILQCLPNLELEIIVTLKGVVLERIGPGTQTFIRQKKSQFWERKGKDYNTVFHSLIISPSFPSGFWDFKKRSKKRSFLSIANSIFLRSIETSSSPCNTLIMNTKTFTLFLLGVAKNRKPGSTLFIDEVLFLVVWYLKRSTSRKTIVFPKLDLKLGQTL